MTADVLREAADVMRTRAQNAPDETRTSGATTGVWLNSAYHLTATPAFLLAVADWLDSEAQSHIHVKGESEPTSTYDLPGMDDSPAVRVARAYLADPA